MWIEFTFPDKVWQQMRKILKIRVALNDLCVYSRCDPTTIPVPPASVAIKPLRTCVIFINFHFFTYFLPNRKVKNLTRDDNNKKTLKGVVAWRSSWNKALFQKTSCVQANFLSICLRTSCNRIYLSNVTLFNDVTSSSEQILRKKRFINAFGDKQKSRLVMDSSRVSDDMQLDL